LLSVADAIGVRDPHGDCRCMANCDNESLFFALFFPSLAASSMMIQTVIALDRFLRIFFPIWLVFDRQYFSSIK
jgi:hypothetical protein